MVDLRLVPNIRVLEYILEYVPYCQFHVGEHYPVVKTHPVSVSELTAEHIERFSGLTVTVHRHLYLHQRVANVIPYLIPYVDVKGTHPDLAIQTVTWMMVL